jgi:hypothetical protein
MVVAPAAPEAATGRSAEDPSSEQRSHLLSYILAEEEDIEEDEAIGSLTHRPQRGLRLLLLVCPRTLALGPSGSTCASTSRAAPAEVRIPMLHAGETGSGTCTWTHLGELPGLGFTILFCLPFGRLSYMSVPCFLMQQGPLPGALSQAVPGRPSCSTRAPSKRRC